MKQERKMPSKSNTATSFYQNSIKIDYLHSFGVISDKTVLWVQIHIAFYALEIGCFLTTAASVLLWRIVNVVGELIKSCVGVGCIGLLFLGISTKKSFSNACTEIVEVHFLCVRGAQAIKMQRVDNSDVKRQLLMENTIFSSYRWAAVAYWLIYQVDTAHCSIVVSYGQRKWYFDFLFFTSAISLDLDIACCSVHSRDASVVVQMQVYAQEFGVQNSRRTFFFNFVSFIICYFFTIFRKFLLLNQFIIIFDTEIIFDTPPNHTLFMICCVITFYRYLFG